MNFNAGRLRRSDQIMGAGAIALFIFMFLFKWYGETASATTLGGVNVGSSSISFNGWHTFTNSRWIWLITIVAALVAVAVAGGAVKLHSPIQLSVLVAGLGALSTILILYRIVHHPTGDASYGSFHASVGIKLGIWLGLLAAAGVTYGGYLAMQDEGTSIADVRGQASAAVANMSSRAPAAPSAGPKRAGTGAAAPSRPASGAQPGPRRSEPAPGPSPAAPQGPPAGPGDRSELPAEPPSATRLPPADPEL